MEELFNKSIQSLEENLKRLWHCNDLQFIGHLQISTSPDEIGFGYITSPYINDREVFYPKNVQRRHVSIRIPLSDQYIVGNYYRVKAILAPLELRKLKNNPYLLLWDESKELVPEFEYSPPKEFIKEWFSQTGATPKDAATIASQLKLNSLELYTHTKRFIFELIQNADDMPSGTKGVAIELYLLDNFLLFRHNGKFFDRNDVKAIADAAQSNKSENVRQTGYKGIGFKSVFTDSSKVFIRSGSYSFKFDRTDQIYQDFWKLYSGYTNQLVPGAFIKFQREFKGNEEKYTNIDNIPWQIKPLWVDKKEYPEELANSPFTKHAEVNIALEIGQSTINEKEYNNMIVSLLSKPKFLLFLRNTNLFEYFEKRSDELVLSKKIELKTTNEIIDILCNGDLTASFIKQDFDIYISNEDFSKSGFSIEKYEEKPGLFKFKDESGDIKNIPEKLGRLESTRLTFAAQTINGEIQKLDKAHSLLYNYLPTSDQRFGFPFLVNADFISSTNREFILDENKWNHYLFYHIGYNCINWCRSLALKGIEEESYQCKVILFGYLNLLPDNLLDENNDELTDIFSAFNRGVKNSIREVEFIVNDDNEIKAAKDIIIDLTGISDVFGINGKSLFHSLYETDKRLPHSNLNKSNLLKPYLDSELFGNAQLLEIFRNTDKCKIIALELLKLSAEEYHSFLSWSDNFFKLTNIGSNILLSFPIIRLEEKVISITEAIGEESLIIKTEKTKGIEDILIIIGFKLTEFYFDNEEYKYIYSVFQQQDSYLKTDVKLYDHIAASKDLSKLTSEGKNSLLSFFESLDDVGKAKYAKSLALFKSKLMNGGLKPLATLISNTCENLPVWLSDFVINQHEEDALSDTFKKNLLKQGDLLEKVFCNPTTFSEIITDVNAENIDEFYAYILKLLKEKSKETKIDFSGIPWVFIEATSSFELPSNVYWPDSITKLLASKYEHVKTILEAVSTEKLPLFAALQLKAPFSLGAKDAELTAIFTKEDSFNVLPLNDFLDWVETNGEKDFLVNFSISKLNETFTIATANGSLQYYTTDESLKIFIEASTHNSKINLLPKEVYTNERSKIGLLQGVDLLNYLLKNGQALPSFSKFVQQENNAELSLHYLELLSEINIDTSKTYTSECDEFRILKLSIRHIISDQEKLKKFRNKITIDDYPLLERAISEDIFFYEKNIGIKTKLSEVLPTYKEKAFPLSDIVAKFEDFNDNKNLITVFKSEGRTPKKILKELNELKVEYYNPTQTFFLSFYKAQYVEEDVLKDKILFTASNSDNLGQFEKEIHQFLDICLKENSYVGFLAQGIIPNFKPTQIVSNEDYAIDSENPPQWFSDWVNLSHSDSKNAYLKLIGINDNSSPVVLFRKAIMEFQLEQININREQINNDQLLVNNLIWLSKQQKQGNLILKKEILQPLYQKLQNRNINVKYLRFPSLQNCQENSYSLESLKEGDELHLVHEGWGEYRQAIFKSLNGSKIITDDVISKEYRDAWKVIEKPFIKLADTEKLKAYSYPFDEEYYQEWDLKTKYNILIYKGTHLPYVIIYNDLIINSVADKYADCISQVYYIVESKKESILFYLEGIMQETALNALKLHKQNLIEKEKEAAKKIKFTEEESEVWRKLFGNEIPAEYYLDINLAACVSALVMLGREGYDVSKADSNLFNSHGLAQIEPVYKDESNGPMTIMCRSAIGGILYLTAQAWDRLGKDKIHLFVKTGKKENNYHFFLDKKDVLAISDTKYQVFRVEADSSSINTDEILKGEFAKDKIWLILKMKDNEIYKSIFEGGIRRNEDNPDYENVNTAEDSPY